MRVALCLLLCPAFAAEPSLERARAWVAKGMATVQTVRHTRQATRDSRDKLAIPADPTDLAARMISAFDKTFASDAAILDTVEHDLETATGDLGALSDATDRRAIAFTISRKKKEILPVLRETADRAAAQREGIAELARIVAFRSHASTPPTRDVSESVAPPADIPPAVALRLLPWTGGHVDLTSIAFDAGTANLDRDSRASNEELEAIAAAATACPRVQLRIAASSSAGSEDARALPARRAQAIVAHLEAAGVQDRHLHASAQPTTTQRDSITVEVITPCS